MTGDDIGVTEVYDNLNEVLAWWIRDWEDMEIKGSGLKRSVIEAVDWCAATRPRGRRGRCASTAGCGGDRPPLVSVAERPARNDGLSYPR